MAVVSVSCSKNMGVMNRSDIQVMSVLSVESVINVVSVVSAVRVVRVMSVKETPPKKMGSTPLLFCAFSVLYESYECRL